MQSRFNSRLHFRLQTSLIIIRMINDTSDTYLLKFTIFALILKGEKTKYTLRFSQLDTIIILFLVCTQLRNRIALTTSLNDIYRAVGAGNIEIRKALNRLIQQGLIYWVGNNAVLNINALMERLDQLPPKIEVEEIEWTLFLQSAMTLFDSDARKCHWHLISQTDKIIFLLILMKQRDFRLTIAELAEYTKRWDIPSTQFAITLRRLKYTYGVLLTRGETFNLPYSLGSLTSDILLNPAHPAFLGQTRFTAYIKHRFNGWSLHIKEEADQDALFNILPELPKPYNFSFTTPACELYKWWDKPHIKPHVRVSTISRSLGSRKKLSIALDHFKVAHFLATEHIRTFLNNDSLAKRHLILSTLEKHPLFSKQSNDNHAEDAYLEELYKATSYAVTQLLKHLEELLSRLPERLDYEQIGQIKLFHHDIRWIREIEPKAISDIDAYSFWHISSQPYNAAFITSLPEQIVATIKDSSSEWQKAVSIHPFTPRLYYPHGYRAGLVFTANLRRVPTRKPKPSEQNTDTNETSVTQIRTPEPWLYELSNLTPWLDFMRKPEMV